MVKGDLKKTIQGINKLLKKDDRSLEYLVVKKIQKHNNYYESEHKGIRILKHLIFDFCKPRILTNNEYSDSHIKKT